MKIIDGWVKRESFPVKNKSACQEATGIGCNCLSESECMASKGRLRSKVETGFSSERMFSRQRAGSGSCYRRLRPGYKSKHFPKSGYKIVAHSVK